MFSMLASPTSVRSQVVAVTHSGRTPSSSILITWKVLSLPPETGTMQSHLVLVVSRYCSISARNSSRRASQSTAVRFS